MFDITTPAVIFDLDGTLYDKKGLALRMIVRQLFHLRLLRSERAVRSELMGLDFGSASAFQEEFFRRLSKLSGKSEAAARNWYYCKYLPSMVSALRSHCRLRPEMAELVSALKARGVRIAVFSDYEFAAQKLVAIGFNLSDASAGVFEASALGGLKPSPQSFLRIAGQMGVGASEITVIGDRNDTDAEGARRCGMKYILI